MGRELAEDNVERVYSTKAAYKCYLDNCILPISDLFEAKKTQEVWDVSRIKSLKIDKNRFKTDSQG